MLNPSLKELKAVTKIRGIKGSIRACLKMSY